MANPIDIPNKQRAWVICDCLTTVAVSRLHLPGRVVLRIGQEDFNKIAALVLKGLPRRRAAAGPSLVRSEFSGRRGVDPLREAGEVEGTGLGQPVMPLPFRLQPDSDRRTAVPTMRCERGALRHDAPAFAHVPICLDGQCAPQAMRRMLPAWRCRTRFVALRVGTRQHPSDQETCGEMKDLSPFLRAARAVADMRRSPLLPAIHSRRPSSASLRQIWTCSPENVGALARYSNSPSRFRQDSASSTSNEASSGPWTTSPG